MQSVVLAGQTDLAGWRMAARRLVMSGVPPDAVAWSVAGDAVDLFAAVPDESSMPASGFSVPRRFVDLARRVICAREAQRFALLYGILWRFVAGERTLLDQPTDPQIHRAEGLAKSVGRDVHKMRAFIRFRELTGAENAFVAWFEPAHYIVEANAPFFVRRFPNMTWSILTPDRSVHWDGEELRFTTGAERSQVPDDDALEAYWRIYYASIFNPARLKIAAMQSEMPKKYWKNLPEARLIPGMIRTAASREAAMVEAGPTTPSRLADSAMRRPAVVPVSAVGGLAGLAAAAASCRNCPLWEPATQTVFGEGAVGAELMLIGEQPGDQEDLAGQVFVGPAGKLLDKALAAAGIDRGRLYITNAVKHFKFVPRGKRRIHQKPGSMEILACSSWLAQERAIVRPRLTLLLGASAGRAVLGRAVAVMRERGRILALPDGGDAMLTVHPAYILRLAGLDEQERAYQGFVADLKSARDVVLGSM